MRARIRTLWLPGVALFFVVQMSLRLVQLLGHEPGTSFLDWPHPLQLYLPWLTFLPFLGAVAALWSRRAGRPRPEWLLLGVFPSIVYAGFVLWFTIGDILVDVVITGNHGLLASFAGTWTFGLQFMVFPGLMLALGAGVVMLLADGRGTGGASRADDRGSTLPEARDSEQPPQSLVVAQAG